MATNLTEITRPSTAPTTPTAGVSSSPFALLTSTGVDAPLPPSNSSSAQLFASPRARDASSPGESRRASSLEETEARRDGSASNDAYAEDPESYDARAPASTGATPPPSTQETTLLAYSLAATMSDEAIEALAAAASAAEAPTLPVNASMAPAGGGAILIEVLPGSIGAALDAASAAATDGADPSGAALAPRAGHASLQLIGRGLHALLLQRGGTLVMRLSPPNLGTLEIHMRLQAGRVEVLFRASGAEASRLLEGNLGMLRQSLERQGVGVGRLAVEPPGFRRAEESAQTALGQSFDAGGRESQGRQEAEREQRWRTGSGLAAATFAPFPFEIAGAPEVSPACPPSRPSPPRPASSPAASAS